MEDEPEEGASSLGGGDGNRLEEVGEVESRVGKVGGGDVLYIH